jgi:hypothetical protein
MKQGTVKTTTDYKTEPKSHAVNPAAVAEIGIHQIRYKSISLYEGRGLEAPMAGQTNHKCGSQGKH